MSKYNDFTQLNYDIIMNTELMEQKCSDAFSILDFLKNPDNFKSLRSTLREAMIRSNVCLENDDDSIFVTSLFNRLEEQENKQTDDHKRKTKKNAIKPFSKKTIEKWFSGDTRSIDSRTDIIRIIFALGLDYDQSIDLLRKTGHTRFIVRDVEDAIYIYCICNGKDLKTAYSIIDEYYELTGKPDINSDKKRSKLEVAKLAESGKGNSCNTTTLLINDFAEALTKKREDFVHDYLIEHTDDFISYSKYALREYSVLKNSVYFPALKNKLNEEFEGRKNARSDLQVTLNVINNLKNYSDFAKTLNNEDQEKISFFIKACEDMHSFFKGELLQTGYEEKKAVIIKCKEITDTIEYECCQQENDSFVQSVVSMFLSEVLRPDLMLEYWLPLLVITNDEGKDTRQRPYGNTPLSNTVLKHFPHRTFFTDYESKPENYSDNPTLRKALILLYFIRYSSDMVTTISAKREDDFLEKEFRFGLVDFIGQLDDLLNRCQLGVLYPANQFDWLILRSVRDIEIYREDYLRICMTGKEDPLYNFKLVLELAFGDDESSDE